MKKRTYLIIISLVTILCIIWGSIHFLGGFISGEESLFGLFGGKDEHIVKDVDLEAFSSLQIDSEIMDVEIKKGDSYKLHYECSKEKLIPTYAVENGKLTIKQKNKKGLTLTFGSSGKCKMVLTVPEEKILSDIKIVSNTGDLIIADTVTEKSDIETDTGDVKVNNSNLGGLTLATDTGDVSFSGVTLGDVKLTTDTGDISMKDMTIAEGDIESDTGDIKIEGIKIEAYNVSMDSDTGDITVNGSNQGNKYNANASEGDGLTMKISTDTGDITVK